MAIHKESVLNSSDGQTLFFQEWMPEKKARCIILYIHGLGSHSGRLDHWAIRFNENDVGFVAMDQRGHGKSSGKKGHAPGIEILMQDIDLAIEKVKEAHPGMNLVLYGHSMGGCEVINYALRSSSKIDGLIASSPWLKLVSPPPKFLVSLVGILKSLAPGLQLSNGLNAADISRENEEVEKYKEDPLVHDKISLSMFHAIHRAGIFALNNGSKLTLPFLLTHGTGDRITSQQASANLADSMGSNVQYKSWDGGYHELHHDKVREELFAYILKWLQTQKFI